LPIGSARQIDDGIDFGIGRKLIEAGDQCDRRDAGLSALAGFRTSAIT